MTEFPFLLERYNIRGCKGHILVWKGLKNLVQLPRKWSGSLWKRHDFSPGAMALEFGSRLRFDIRHCRSGVAAVADLRIAILT
jgi:hypothetical protein